MPPALNHWRGNNNTPGPIMELTMLKIRTLEGCNLSFKKECFRVEVGKLVESSSCTLVNIISNKNKLQ